MSEMTPTKAQGATSVFNIKCPACGKRSVYGPKNPARPFCSLSCKTGDLAAWASDEYRAPGSPDNITGANPDKDHDDSEY